MDPNHEHMLAFEVAYSEDPVVAGAGGETYRRPVPPLAPLGTILLPVGCLVRLRQRPQRQYSVPPFSVSAATGSVIRHRQRRFSLPSDSEVVHKLGNFQQVSPWDRKCGVGFFGQCADERLVVRPDDDWLTFKVCSEFVYRIRNCE